MQDKCQDHDSRSSHTYSSDEFLREDTFGAKAFGLKSHVLLGLGVKGWVLDQGIHKHPNMVFNLKKKNRN